MEKIEVDIIAIVHRIFTDGKRKKGGADKILSYFSQEGKKVILIEHPLSGLREKGDQKWNEVIVSMVEKGEVREVSKVKIKTGKTHLRWLSEIVFNIKFINRKVIGKPCFFCADPLGGLGAVIFKSKFSKRYFHCVDYSKKRFDNIFLNFIYRSVFLLVAKKFDLISVVSQRTKKDLMRLRIPGDKIFYLPNSPDYKVINFQKKRNILAYTSGSIIEKYNYIFVLDLLFCLKKSYPKIKLYAGGGKSVDAEYYKEVEKKVVDLKLKDNIVFFGFVEEEEIEKLLSRAKIGLSFYSETVRPYTYYGDSLKIREYALYGVPTIADGNSATDEEMVKEGCGFIVKDVDEAVEKIRFLLGDETNYSTYESNCLNWTKKNDKKKLLDRLYNKIFNEK